MRVYQAFWHLGGHSRRAVKVEVFCRNVPQRRAEAMLAVPDNGDNFSDWCTTRSAALQDLLDKRRANIVEPLQRQVDEQIKIQRGIREELRKARVYEGVAHKEAE